MTGFRQSASVPVFCGFLAFLLAAGRAGPLSAEVSRVLTALALAGVVFWTIRLSNIHGWRLRCLWALPAVPILFGYLSRSAGDVLQVAGVLLVLTATASLTRDAAGIGAAARLTAKAVAGGALLLLALRHFGWVTLSLSFVSEQISRLGGALVGDQVRIGPTFSGIWVLILFSLLVVAAAAEAGWNRRVILFGSILICQSLVAVLAYVALLPAIESSLTEAMGAMLATPGPHRSFSVVPGQVAAYTVFLVVLALLPAAGRFLAVLASPLERMPSFRWLPAAAGAALLLVAGFNLTPRLLPPLHDRPRILFCERSALDWSVPTHGKYGLVAVGMFGEMQTYLRAAGYEVAVHSGSLQPSDLKLASAMVVINPEKGFSKDELDAIWDFVRGGGGLLVLGDHTDIFGTQTPLNELLAPVKVRFEFDAAFPLRKHWRQSQEFLPSPLTAGLVSQLDDGIATGASLLLDGFRARPIIMGRYAFSDLGNRANGGTGAYLGDYRYELGERLGDVVLVADALYGRGRVVVFGDTSSFQPLSLPFAWPFVERVFRYVSLPTEGVGWPRALGWLALVLGAAAVFVSKPPLGWIAVIALFLTAGDAIHDWRGAPRTAPLPATSVAMIDASHLERMPLDFFETHSMGGVIPALMRAGWLPLVRMSSTSEFRDSASLAVYVAPERPVEARELEALRSMLQRGGNLIVVSGNQTAAAASQLLGLCGLRLGDYPVGPAMATVGEQSVQFVDAWPVLAGGAGPMVQIAAQGKDVLIAEATASPGRCLAIGDGRFFEDENFEGEFQFRRANVEFFDQVLSGLSKRDR